jgi:hypothetical protein
MSGVRSKGVPPSLKVVGFVDRPGFIMDCEITLAGAGALDRAGVMAQALRQRLQPWTDENIVVDLVGSASVLGPLSQVLRGPVPEIRVHVSARCNDPEEAQLIEDEVYAMTLSGPAGGCSVRSERRLRIEVLDGFISHDRVPTHIVWSQS